MNILGTKWTVQEADDRTDQKLKECDGYCDDTIKVCVVDSMTDKSAMSKANLDEYKKKVTRHEVIHAFLFESGLASNSWANNEELVDWIALQFPKLMAAFKELECI